MRALTLSLWAAGGGTPVTLNPDPAQLPGINVIQQLTDGLGGWALIASMVGIVVGAIVWAFGHYSQNYHQAYNGRRGVIVSAAAALLVGGAPHIVAFFLHQGNHIS